jgi:DNA-binding MarR family transcriptional regulator
LAPLQIQNQIYDGQLAKCELKAGQYSILRVLNRLKQSSNRDLQDILVIDQSTLTRGLKPLIRDGYIQSRPGNDRRVKLLCLAPGGRTCAKRPPNYGR